MDRIHLLLDDKPADDLAIIDHDGRRVTFGDLRHMAQCLAEALTLHGIRPGDRLALIAENSAFYAAAIMAASMNDAWITLVNARQSETEIADIMAHSGARAAIFTTDASAEARAHAARMQATEIGTLPMGPNMGPNMGPILASPIRDALPEPCTASGDQIAALLYTTGTTSTPKAVMLRHRNLYFNAVNSAAYNALAPGDQVLAILPGTHVYGFASLFITAMHAGAAIRFVPRFDPADTLAHLRDGVTIFPGVPAMFAALLAHLSQTGAPLDAPRLRSIGAGGAPLDPDLKIRIEALFGLPLSNGYGLTETTAAVSISSKSAPQSDISVGAPVPGVDVRIDAPNAQGIGEVLIRGGNVMAGYYRDPAQSAAVLGPGGWFRSGDLGWLEEDGRLHISGRLKELIIRSGFNIYPPEIEAMLTRHPAIRQAAVIGRKHGGDEEILAFVLTDGSVTEPMIEKWLRRRLAAYKIPQHILIVEAYPVAATGKILKHRLVSHFADLLAARAAIEA